MSPMENDYNADHVVAVVVVEAVVVAFASAATMIEAQ